MPIKVLYGGRGAGRSWGVARALVLIGTQKEIRVLCVRELQNSIAESVHKVLSDQISLLGLDWFYKIEVGKITGQNGTVFTFEGIKNNTTKIKSYEGIDYCWVEEANKVSRNSWEILLPTIRKKGSEIWITFNPELDTDYTYKRFVLEPDKDSFVVKMTWKDNPWFHNTTLPKQMENMKERDYDAYLNIWEGHCRQALQGAVFAKELRLAQESGRIVSKKDGGVPWFKQTPVDTYWDLGRRDMTSIWFAQRVGMQYRILKYFEDSQEDIHYYLRYCQNQGYTYGHFYLPHDARAKRLGEKRSIEQIVRETGYRTFVVKRTNKKANAINAARILFSNCWFDEEHCQDGLTRLRHYRYKIIEGQSQDGSSMLSEEPLHDENSNAADGFMTMGQSMKTQFGPEKEIKLSAPQSKYADIIPGLGWMS